MKLADYLSETNTTVTAFARKIDEAQATVSRYVNGQRIPERAIMSKIVQATEGRVTPNDFYELSQGAAAS